MEGHWACVGQERAEGICWHVSTDAWPAVAKLLSQVTSANTPPTGKTPPGRNGTSPWMEPHGKCQMLEIAGFLVRKWSSPLVSIWPDGLGPLPGASHKSLTSQTWRAVGGRFSWRTPLDLTAARRSMVVQRWPSSPAFEGDEHIKADTLRLAGKPPALRNAADARSHCGTNGVEYNGEHKIGACARKTLSCRSGWSWSRSPAAALPPSSSLGRLNQPAAHQGASDGPDESFPARGRLHDRHGPAVRFSA